MRDLLILCISVSAVLSGLSGPAPTYLPFSITATRSDKAELAKASAPLEANKNQLASGKVR